jgi:hypothetical protein
VSFVVKFTYHLCKFDLLSSSSQNQPAMRKITLFLALFLSVVISGHTQVAIGTDNTPPANSAMLDIQSTSKGILVPRMTAAQRTAISSPANGLMVYQTDGTTGFYYYNGTAWTSLAGSGGTSPGHYIGELFGGGIVCWVDNTGQHGLIVSLVDISLNALWSSTYTVMGAGSSWNGSENTTLIGGVSPAAQACINYTNSSVYGTGTYSDWYLPAIDELSLVYQSRCILNKIIYNSGLPASILAYQYYWSSTESAYNYAWYFNFTSGTAYNYCMKSTSNWVRAVRAF